tara:strand:+ start:386 stop:2128 length:1743 start_codon:yes stop_codon:yes gene_type:complete
MKKVFLSAFILFPLFLSSQAIDQEYLDSLPEEVRKDVMSNIDAKNATEDPVYRKASTMIDKEIDLNNFSKLPKFGDSFFDTMQSSFMPINEPNFDGSYVLDTGDVLEIQLIGQEDSIESYAIKRDGSISMPDIGSIKLSGLSLNNASSLLKAKVKTFYIGTEVFISLINIRDIRVLISGNAFNPGIYTLNGNSNILHALTMAGGIDKLGSYRNIELIRNNEVVDNLDLYDVIIFGKASFSKRLQSGDSILVKPAIRSVSIISGVRRPGIYELKKEETFRDLINFANGINPNADLKNINLFTLKSGKINQIAIDFSLLESYKPSDSDKLVIREYKFNTVSIRGAVKNPGEYTLSQGAFLSELINRAGGYEDTAYQFGGYLSNQRSMEINSQAKDKLYNKFLNSLIQNSSNNSENNNLPLVLQQIKDAPSSGRVIAEFDLDLIKANSNLDTILEDGDELLIPYISQQVYVYGEVSNQGAIRYLPGKPYTYYLKDSGGSLNSADLDNIFIVNPNGKTVNISSNNKKLSFLSSNNPDTLIFPGSIIYVPKDTNMNNSLAVASIWAPLVSSLALSLTSLSVLSND